ncbi:MAG TPA: hypothetical protein VGP07_18450 [Polyangia bacterium]
MALLLVVVATAVGGCGRAGGGAGPPGIGGSTSVGGDGGAATGGAGGGEGTLALLVDHDQSSNNVEPGFPPSYSDALFEVDLTVDRIPYETIAVPPGGGAPPPAFGQLARYTALLWYTADGTSELFSSTEQAEVERWLDLGHKTLIIFSENLLSDIGAGGAWTAPTDDTFLTAYLGAAGWAADGDADVAGAGAVSLKNRLYTVDGASGTPLAGMHFEVFDDTPIESTADLVNPGAATVVLATVDADPADEGSNAATPIVVAHTVGTSTVIYVGMPVENVDGAPGNTSAELVHGILQFAGLVP